MHLWHWCHVSPESYDSLKAHFGSLRVRSGRGLKHGKTVCSCSEAACGFLTGLWPLRVEAGVQAHGSAAKTRVGQRLGVSDWRTVVLAGDDVFAQLGEASGGLCTRDLGVIPVSNCCSECYLKL